MRAGATWAVSSARPASASPPRSRFPPATTRVTADSSSTCNELLSSNCFCRHRKEKNVCAQGDHRTIHQRSALKINSCGFFSLHIDKADNRKLTSPQKTAIFIIDGRLLSEIFSFIQRKFIPNIFNYSRRALTEFQIISGHPLDE